MASWALLLGLTYFGGPKSCYVAQASLKFQARAIFLLGRQMEAVEPGLDLPLFSPFSPVRGSTRVFSEVFLLCLQGYLSKDSLLRKSSLDVLNC